MLNATKLVGQQASEGRRGGRQAGARAGRDWRRSQRHAHEVQQVIDAIGVAQSLKVVGRLGIERLLEVIKVRHAPRHAGHVVRQRMSRIDSNVIGNDATMATITRVSESERASMQA